MFSHECVKLYSGLTKKPHHAYFPVYIWQTVVVFAEMNNLKVVNADNGHGKGQIVKQKNEIHFILTDRQNIVKNIAVHNKLKSSNQRLVRCKVTLNFRKERDKLIIRKKSKYHIN